MPGSENAFPPPELFIVNDINKVRFPFTHSIYSIVEWSICSNFLSFTVNYALIFCHGSQVPTASAA